MDTLTIKAKCAQNIQPIDPTGLFLVDDEDCPDISGKGGNKDGQVGKGEGNGNAVHDGGRLPDQAEVHPHQHHPFLPQLHAQLFSSSDTIANSICLSLVWLVSHGLNNTDHQSPTGS